MAGKIVWRTVRVSRAGLLFYRVVWFDEPMPYGIEVICKDDLARHRHLTADRQQALAWGRRLAQGRVRPCHLQELLMDWICE